MLLAVLRSGVTFVWSVPAPGTKGWLAGAETGSRTTSPAAAWSSLPPTSSRTDPASAMATTTEIVTTAFRPLLGSLRRRDEDGGRRAAPSGTNGAFGPGRARGPDAASDAGDTGERVGRPDGAT